MSTRTCTGGSPVHRAPTPLPAWRQVVLAALTIAWQRVTRQPRPLAYCQRMAGFPARHPESLTRRLSRRDERWLAQLQARLWGAGEIPAVTDTWRLS
jgi:hypothetical protein